MTRSAPPLMEITMDIIDVLNKIADLTEMYYQCGDSDLRDKLRKEINDLINSFLILLNK